MICEHPQCTGKHRMGFAWKLLCPASKAKAYIRSRKYVLANPGKVRIYNQRYNISSKGMLRVLKRVASKRIGL